MQCRTLERFCEILANYDFSLEYTAFQIYKGEDIRSNFLSRLLAVESIEVRSQSTLAKNKSSQISVESGTLKIEVGQILHCDASNQTKVVEEKKVRVLKVRTKMMQQCMQLHVVQRKKVCCRVLQHRTQCA